MIAPLDPAFQQPGGNLLGDELLEVISDAITNHPRSLQAAIGPSEIGVECGRRIAYKLLGVPERKRPSPNWLATVGTAVHAWLEGQFDTDNVKRAPHLDGQERWLIETKLTVGFVPGLGFVTGSCDLYDRVTRTVVDWKIVGPTALKKYKAQGPSLQYRTQAALYGQGWVNAGHPVDTVAIAFLPRNGELRELHFWSEPFDPAIAAAALARLAQIKAACDQHGLGVLPLANTADNYCGHCSWFSYGSTDPTKGCPGDPASPAARTTTPALSLSA